MWHPGHLTLTPALSQLCCLQGQPSSQLSSFSVKGCRARESLGAQAEGGGGQMSQLFPSPSLHLTLGHPVTVM